MQTVSNQILSDIIIYDKYARYIPEEQRREVWEEICKRNAEMHKNKYPKLADKIDKIYNDYVIPKQILPSMRSIQFAGPAIVRNPSRVYNCAYLPIDDRRAFSELMFLLLGGTGVGYSVQFRHVNNLPTIKGLKEGKRARRFVIGDSIEGWSDSIKALTKAYFEGETPVKFDFSDIRPKGTPLKTSGGIAPGPNPLRKCLLAIEAILVNAVGRKLTPLEVHDICCHIADAVLAGGIRRAAMIALFSIDDIEMMTCKSGTWYETNPQRGRANNSVILLRGSISKDDFIRIWKRVQQSGSGEPGIYWTNNLDWGTNPCGEIALRPFQFCNLTTVNVSDIKSQSELNKRASAASFIGTLQAGYTNFHYLRPIWQDTTEEDALIGVSMTGIGSGKILNFDLAEAANVVMETNSVVSKAIGINECARGTTLKPEGTGSIVIGCSSGVHAWHSKYYLRRVRLIKNGPLYNYLISVMPDAIEDDFFDPINGAVVTIPQRAPDGAIYRDESAMDLIERVMWFNKEWIKHGYRHGENDNNVSATISVKENEWDVVGEAFWEYRDLYNGMTVLPYDGGTYTQAPFEECTEYEYRKRFKQLETIDLRNVIEFADGTSFTQEAACAGGVCTI